MIWTDVNIGGFNFIGYPCYNGLHHYDAIILADHNLAICVKITNSPK